MGHKKENAANVNGTVSAGTRGIASEDGSAGNLKHGKPRAKDAIPP
ncbi:tpr protein K [Treponema pallidum subsp. pallidum str. Chicago]|nr:tpr protein K [Treponema pallidum subsp. pallidum str. Chicago]